MTEHYKNHSVPNTLLSICNALDSVTGEANACFNFKILQSYRLKQDCAEVEKIEK